MDLISASMVGPQGQFSSVMGYGVGHQNDFFDGASTLCSAIHMTTGSVAAEKLGEGFGFASAATGCAGLVRDVGIVATSARELDGKGVLLGTALGVYDASKVASFAETAGACSTLPSYVHTIGKGWALGTVVTMSLVDDVQTLQKPTQGSNPLQSELLEKRWWMHAFNAGANLSTLIYSVSVIAGYILNPVLGIFLATTYLVCAVVAHVFTKDMEQAAIRNGLNH